jgi:hypothetical protein
MQVMLLFAAQAPTKFSTWAENAASVRLIDRFSVWILAGA